MLNVVGDYYEVDIYMSDYNTPEDYIFTVLMSGVIAALLCGLIATIIGGFFGYYSYHDELMKVQGELNAMRLYYPLDRKDFTVNGLSK